MPLHTLDLPMYEYGCMEPQCFNISLSWLSYVTVCHICQFHITLGKGLVKISKPQSYFILIRSYVIHVCVFPSLVNLLFVFRKSSSSTSSGPQSATPGEEKNFFSQFLSATPNGSGSNSSCNSQDNHSAKVITALL